MFKQKTNGKDMLYGPNGIQLQWKRQYGHNEICPHGLQLQWKRHGFT